MEFNRNCVLYETDTKRMLDILQNRSDEKISVKEVLSNVFLVTVRWVTKIPVLQRKINQYHEASLLLFEKESIVALFHFPEEESIQLLKQTLQEEQSFTKVSFFSLFKNQIFNQIDTPFIVSNLSCPKQASSVFFFDEDHSSLDTLHLPTVTPEQIVYFLRERELLRISLFSNETKKRPFHIHIGDRLEFYDTQSDKEVIELLQGLIAFKQKTPIFP